MSPKSCKNRMCVSCKILFMYRRDLSQCGRFRRGLYYCSFCLFCLQPIYYFVSKHWPKSWPNWLYNIKQRPYSRPAPKFVHIQSMLFIDKLRDNPGRNGWNILTIKLHSWPSSSPKDILVVRADCAGRANIYCWAIKHHSTV